MHIFRRGGADRSLRRRFGSLSRLTAVVLVTGREMTVEAMAAKQHLSQAQVDAAEQGAEQFAISVVAQEMQTPGYMQTLNFEARPLGNCYIWFIRQNLDDETAYDYGMQDEAAKIDINTATESMLEYLPNMDVNVAAAIVDWRDPDDNVTDAASGAIGAETSDYQSMTTPYSAKNAPFETVEELMLVEGMTTDLAWGADRNHNNVIDQNESAMRLIPGRILTATRCWGFFPTPRFTGCGRPMPARARRPSRYRAGRESPG